MVEPWTWRKSSFSGENVPACVVVAWNGDQAMVRDSKSLQGPELSFSPAGWQAFIGHIAAAPAPARSAPGSG